MYYHTPMIVLGIETSCDETGVALFDKKRGLLAQALHSQADLHSVYGGVVPEIAARDHIRCLLPLVNQVLGAANIKKPDIVAYTAGPGLIGALMVGGGLASGLALAWDCKILPIHHMEGHLAAPFLESNPPRYPFIALLVSGGHTMLVLVTSFGKYQILGTTLDDAAGEAFDKIAKILDLGYPGGPAIAELAKEGNETAYPFPRPMINHAGFDFSFSGLKTAVMLTIQSEQKKGLNKKIKANIAASFQRAVIDTLVAKTINVAKIENINRIVIAGGVGANLLLRHELEYHFDGEIHFPKVELCTDNGVMIAVAGAFRCAEAIDVSEIKATARWSLESLISV